MFKKALITVFAILLFAGYSIFLPDTGHSRQVRVKFATVAPEGSTWMKHMRYLDKTIRAKSNGEIGFKLYPGGIAGDELDVLKKIRIGQIHCAAFSGVGFGRILPMVRVLDLPFFFRNNREIDLVHKKLFSYFSKNFHRKGFELLAWAEVGNVHIFSKKPIRKASDLSRLKIWTWSGDPISKATFSQMGVNPIPLSVTDVTTSLNTGMIDAVYAPPLGALALQWHTYLKYMTSFPLAHSTGAILISAGYFKKIPAALSIMLKREIELAMINLTSELRKQSEEAITLIQKSGIKLIPKPSDADLKEFNKIHHQVAQNLAGKIYPKKLLGRVYQVLKRPVTTLEPK